MKFNSDNRNHWDGEEVKLLRDVLHVLLSTSNDQSNQIERFQEYLEYADVKQHVIHNMAKLVHSVEKKCQSTPKFRSNSMRILEILDFKDPGENKEDMDNR